MKHDSGCELSIVVPMFNEAENVNRSFLSINHEMQNFSSHWEVIFVNDGSTDDSLKIAKLLEEKEKNLHVLSYSNNIGRGKALRTGLDAARGRYIVTIDFDLSYSPDHILKLYSELKNDETLDLVLASPYMPGGKVENIPVNRLLISKLGNLILRWSFSQSFYTVTSVMRGYTASAVSRLDLQSNGKEIHLEILSKGLAIGFNCKEIPAVLKGRKKGKSKFRFARTSITHLLFSLFERPVIIFMLLGSTIFFFGLFLGLYIIYLRFSGTLNIRPLVDFVVLLIMVGVQLISFGVLAGQNGILRKEIFKLQSAQKTFLKYSEPQNKENINEI